MQWPASSANDLRRDRARDWERTARLTLALAVGVGVLAAALSPRWNTGDLLVVVYFAAVSLGLWAQGTRIRLARSSAPFTSAGAVALGAASAIGLLLPGLRPSPTRRACPPSLLRSVGRAW
jgi:hypothetical protein